MLLYAVTDRTWLGGGALATQVERAIVGGATCIQLREKEMATDEFIREARQIKRLTDRYGVPFVVNDNIEVALAADADGVHVGQGDMCAQDVRKLIGPDKILGVSVFAPGQATFAQQCGADYLGVGAVFATSTKADADTVSLDTLRQICAAVSIPVVAIGGIGESNILRLSGSGIAGVAVISAIFAQSDICAATKTLLRLCAQAVA